MNIIGWLLSVFGGLKLAGPGADWTLATFRDAEGFRREFLVFDSGHSVLLSRSTRLERLYWVSVD